jgi:hypothetical protein
VREQLAGVSVEPCAGVRWAEPAMPATRWRALARLSRRHRRRSSRRSSSTALSVLSASSRTNAGAAERGEGGAGAYGSEAPQLGVGWLKARQTPPAPLLLCAAQAASAGLRGLAKRGNSLAGGSTVKPLAILVVVARSISDSRRASRRLTVAWRRPPGDVLYPTVSPTPKRRRPAATRCGLESTMSS